jgi:radical SAM protein (TIGR04043 family)
MATTEAGLPAGPDLGRLIIELQARGVRVEESGGADRSGGAGPSDAGMIWVEGTPVTFPFISDYVHDSPFTLRQVNGSWGLFREERWLASADIPPRPRFYDLTTDEGIPYWQIALLHLDSLASTVIQTCLYWDTPDQCTFCGIELSLEAGRTVPVKKPEHLAQVAVAAKELDGAVDITLTTGTTKGPDKGARYVARCAEAMHGASGLPVQVQFEPPDDLEVLDEVKDAGVSSVGMHVETFDPEILARIAPAKAATGIEGYFRAWERGVEVFGKGQISTYVILGMGEDPALTVEGCRRAIDLGVYPFVVPLRPVPGSLMEEVLPPAPDYVESVYRQVAPYLASRGLGSWEVHAGCARCQACSAMAAFEREEPDGADRRYLPILSTS